MPGGVQLYRNGRVVTAPDGPVSEAFAVSGDRIAAVGSSAELSRHYPGAPYTDLHGRTVTPGLIDPHMHLLGTAARRLGLDCSHAAASDRDAVLGLVRMAAAIQPPGTWIRGYGVDEAFWADDRMPTAAELDAAAPAHPVLLRHASGHGVLVNSRAALALGVRAGFHADPAWRRQPPLLPLAALREAVAAVARDLLSLGITHVGDLSGENGPAEATLLAGWASDGTWPLGLSLYVNPEHASLVRQTPPVDGLKQVLGVKHVLGERRLSRALADRLQCDLAAAQTDGPQVAMHVVDLPTLSWLLDLEAAAPGLLRGQRIEHLSLCPPGWEGRLAAAGVHVVTQPAFLHERGEKYRREVPEHCWEWLYPVHRLLAVGVPVAGSSDSPVAEPDPWRGMLSAVQRRTRLGHALGAPAALTRAELLGLYTTGAAAALRAEGELGRIAPGYRADFAVWDTDPLTCADAALPSVCPSLTCVRGTVRWQQTPILT